ncbi:MAG: NYN domain-containing protein [Beijerinckiaceae bacterium]
MRVAILVDGGLFLKRFRHIYPEVKYDDPKAVAEAMYTMAARHLYRREKPDAGGKWRNVRDGELHRIMFYDCPPLEKRLHKPISKKAINLADTPEAKFRIAFHEELRKRRKVALRLGRLDEKNAAWKLKAGILQSLLKSERDFKDLKDEDFIYYARQKVVDTKIGLDIALLSEKKQVERIVLVAGDSDFVPAAKHARREGVDFVLDPMWNPITPDLFEHIDGLRSTALDPKKRGMRNNRAEADDAVIDLGEF